MLLGLNPFSEAEDDFRPDHVPGHILSNVVVGTVRLRQQRVRLECQESNQLNLKQSDILCYHPDLHAYFEDSDWAWPRFLATAGAASIFSWCSVGNLFNRPLFSLLKNIFCCML